MARCDIIASHCCAGPTYHMGIARAVHQCNTHGMTDIGPVEQCPIGRIEEAAEKALAEIAAAKAAK